MAVRIEAERKVADFLNGVRQLGQLGRVEIALHLAYRHGCARRVNITFHAIDRSAAYAGRAAVRWLHC